MAVDPVMCSLARPMARPRSQQNSSSLPNGDDLHDALTSGNVALFSQLPCHLSLRLQTIGAAIQRRTASDRDVRPPEISELGRSLGFLAALKNMFNAQMVTDLLDAWVCEHKKEIYLPDHCRMP